MKKTIFGLVIVGLVLSIGYNVALLSNQQTVTANVTDKERIVEMSEGLSDSYYLIYTNKGTYKLEDNLFYGNFRSSDWYGKIKKDSTYTFDLIGYRIGVTSSYQEIVKFK
jgi:hypothetical protein